VEQTLAGMFGVSVVGTTLLHLWLTR
jgi:hypothetical protein